jgi:hypothetical protein
MTERIASLVMIQAIFKHLFQKVAPYVLRSPAVQADLVCHYVVIINMFIITMEKVHHLAIVRIRVRKGLHISNNLRLKL